MLSCWNREGSCAITVIASGKGFTETQSRLKVLTRPSAISLNSGLRTDVEHGSILISMSSDLVSFAMKQESLSVSHSMGYAKVLM